MGECDVCTDKNISLNDHDPGLPCSWNQWITEYKIIDQLNGEPLHIKNTNTIKTQGNLSEAIKLLEAQLPKLCKHVYTTQKQYKESRILKEKGKMMLSSTLIFEYGFLSRDLPHGPVYLYVIPYLSPVITNTQLHHISSLIMTYNHFSDPSVYILTS